MTRTNRSLIATVAVLLGTLLALASSTTASAQDIPALQRAPEDSPPPAGTEWKLVLGGLGTTAGMYGVAAGASYLTSSPELGRDWRLPVVGPWLALGHVGCEQNDPTCSTFNVVMRSAFSIVDGLGQAGGLLLTIEGLFLPTASEENSPSSPSSSQPPRPTDEKKVFIAPTSIGVGGIGLGFSGVF